MVLQARCFLFLAFLPGEQHFQMLTSAALQNMVALASASSISTCKPRLTLHQVKAAIAHTLEWLVPFRTSFRVWLYHVDVLTLLIFHWTAMPSMLYSASNSPPWCISDDSFLHLPAYIACTLFLLCTVLHAQDTLRGLIPAKSFHFCILLASIQLHAQHQACSCR